MRLKQTVMIPRSSCAWVQGVLLITVAIVRGDAAGVPQGGGGLVLHGVLGPRENVAPQEFAFSQGLVKRSVQVVVQDITVDAHVEHELGHVGTLPGERHFRESVIDGNDRGAHFVTGSHRFPSTRVDVLAGANSRHQRCGPPVWPEDGDSVMDVRRVPSHELRHALGRTGEKRSS